MEQLLYAVAGLVARIHNFILSWNDSVEANFTDKELHFSVIGLFGLALICALHPLFLWLAQKGHTMFITFFYVFTVIIVITFAIEIGQGVLGLGNMEQGDITYGIMGFLFFFAIFAVIRAIVHFIIKAKNKPKTGRYYS